jgi:adenylate cyclase
VEKAAQCALAMIERMQAINDSLGKVISKPAYAGIGLHYGPVIAGNLGSENHLSYSITGDTVNTAKRIESLAPAGQNTVLMSDAAYDQLGGDAVVSK